MKKSIKLPILFMDERQQALEEMDIRTPISEHHERDVIFYNIDCIAPSIEDGMMYTGIYSGGDCFLTTLSMDQVDSMICEARKGVKNE